MKLKRLAAMALTGALALSMTTTAFAYPAHPNDEGIGNWAFEPGYDNTWKSAAYIIEPDMPTPSDWAAEYVYVVITRGTYYMPDYNKATDTMGVNLKSWQASMTRDDFAETIASAFANSYDKFVGTHPSKKTTNEVLDQFMDDWLNKYTDRNKAWQNDSLADFSDYKSNGGNLEFADWVCFVDPYKNPNTACIRAYTFNDIENIWIEKLAALGVISGVGDNNFNPTGTITREQAATILVRLMDKMDIPVEQSTTKYTDDDKISDYAKEAVYKVSNIKDATGAPLMQGTGAGTFDPQAPLTNEQCMVIAVRLYDFLTSYYNSIAI